MMGSGAPGGFGNFYDLIGLLDDPAKYDSKLRELDRRVDDARNMIATAVENNRQADAKHKLAEDMLNQVNAKVALANELRDQHEKSSIDLSTREKELTDKGAALAAAQEELEKYKKLTLDDIVARRGTVAANEKAIKDTQDKLVQLRKDTDAELVRLKAEAEAERNSWLAKIKEEFNSMLASRKEAEKIKALMEQKRREYEAFIAKI